MRVAHLYDGDMGENAIYNVDGHEGSGYLAFPKVGTGPAVIVIQEWWGLVGHIKDVVNRFAEAGFVALAPDLYHGQTTREPDMARKLMMELKLENASKEIVGAAQYLLGLPQTSSDHVATVGFCMGGALAIWSATLSPKIRDAVAFYPSTAWDRHLPDWQNFKSKKAMIHCSEGDGTSAAPGIQKAKVEIENAGGSVVTYDYPNTAHAFFNSDRPEVFNENAANLAWNRTLDFLRH
jgi:carboxymethylenebutenolidase